MSTRRSSRRHVPLAVLAAISGITVALVSGATAAPTALPQRAGVVDLATQANLRIDGARPNDYLGFSVAIAGDVNGDGLDDVVVGAPNASPGVARAGIAWVVFGSPSGRRIDLDSLGDRGFRIDGAAASDRTGSAVASAGDVNGDGRADLIIGAPGADDVRQDSGAAYVVFGKTSRTPVDLAALGSQGFRITGHAAGEAGASVAGAGDVNRDGRADLLVGAPSLDNGGLARAGQAFVVFGSSSTDEVRLAALGDRGFGIGGAAREGRTGWSVAGGRDVNCDGRADLLIGAPRADDEAGSAYVVFGKATPSGVFLGALGANGYRIDGPAAGARIGESVAVVGDVDGDKCGDLAFGSVSLRGAFVVFGKPSSTTVDLNNLGSRGFKIETARGDLAGWSVSGGGDVNGDRRRDVLVGGPNASTGGRTRAGVAYVVYGKRTGTTVGLGALRARGFRINGAAVDDEAGWSVSGEGDVNGDGRPDVLVGAPRADNNGRTSSGSAYVIYGFGPPALEYRELSARRGVAIKPHAPTRLARTGTATFTVSPALPAGLTLGPQGVITGTPTQTQVLPKTHRVTMTDLVGQVTAEIRVRVGT